MPPVGKPGGRRGEETAPGLTAGRAQSQSRLLEGNLVLSA